MNTDHTAGLDPATFEAAPGDAWGHFEAEGPDQAQDQATIALTLTQVADLVDLLDEIDEFLRLGHHASTR